jgi:hypothetical protein
VANAERLLELQAKIVEIDQLQKSFDYKGPRWDQNHWRLPVGSNTFYETATRCGTLMCAAGWTCEMDAERRGDKEPWAADHLMYAVPEEIVSGLASTGLAWGRDIDRPVVSVRERAQRILELTDEEVNHLFYGIDNDIEDLKKAVADIIAGRVDNYDEDDEDDEYVDDDDD